jgi:hypothetical protein
MKEITTTYTAEITGIDRHVSDEDLDMIPKGNELRSHMERAIKEYLGAADVHIRDLKLFIRDEDDFDG